MGFPRIKVRHILLSLVTTLGLINLLKNCSNYDRYASRAISGTDFLEVTGSQDCPICFGQDYCGIVNPSSSVVTVTGEDGNYFYKVTSGDGDQHLFQSLSSFPVAKAAHDNFAEFVCANATFAFGGNDDEEDEDESSSCDLSSASKMSFLRTASVKGSVEDGFFGESPTIAKCSSVKLVESLVRAFDSDGDDTLSFSEKSVLLTTLATWPHMAVHRLARSQGSSIFFPGVVGACGKMALLSEKVPPISLALAARSNLDLGTRAKLAALSLQAALDMAYSDANWAFLTDDFSLENLVFVPFEMCEELFHGDGKVGLWDLSKVIVLDKNLFHEGGKGTEDCDFKCEEDFYQKLAGQGGGGVGHESELCSSAGDRLGYMAAIVCKKVIMGEDLLRKGDPMWPEIESLLWECAAGETGRKEAAEKLVEQLLKAHRDSLGRP